MASPGTTKPAQFRLSEAVLAQIDMIAAHHGLTTRADAIRLMAKAESDRIAKKNPKKGRDTT